MASDTIPCGPPLSLLEALKRLGESEDAVAKALLEGCHLGKREDACRCPIARYLEACGFEDPCGERALLVLPRARAEAAVMICAACFVGDLPIPAANADGRAEGSFLLALADAKARGIDKVAATLCKQHRADYEMMVEFVGRGVMEARSS